MATVFERERNAKRDDKKAKAAAAKEAKNAVIMGKINEEFAEKKTAADAAPDAV
jgi:hypothetical protein